MRKFIFTFALLSVVFAGCAGPGEPPTYFDRLGEALLNRAPKLGQDIAENPSPPGIAVAIFEWLIGSIAVAGAGAGAVVAVKKVRRKRKAISAPLPLPPASDPSEAF